MKGMSLQKLGARILAFLAPLLALAAHAEGTAGVPTDWALGLQPGVTPVKHQIEDFHTLLLYICFGISALVLLLLIIVMIRFNARRNPTPSRASHNTLIEVIWTVLPVVILVVIAIPSFRLLYFADRSHNPEMTLKVTGKQWFWQYAYPDQGVEEFDSRIAYDGRPGADGKVPPVPRGVLPLLDVTDPVVLPVDTEIRILVTAGDVIHSWAVPAFGVKTDAVPGRVNETWVKIEKEGTYYGQCSELCGADHGYMPIAVKAVSKQDFQKWVAERKAAGGAAPSASPQ
jgi:cytochrome c oxidase subunit II